MNAINHPLLRYHGGKWRLATWIIEQFPAHRVYVEPYGGAASVLLRKPRSYAEVYNDLDGEVVNLFRVLRNKEQASDLINQVELTPYAREEFEISYAPTTDPVEQARRTLFRFAAGFATGAQKKYGTGFRNNTQRAGSTPADVWAKMPDTLWAIVARLRGVVIENKPAVEIMRIFDTPETLFYVDPPYVFETRGKRTAGQTYTVEMEDAEHVSMGETLNSLQGIVILSGYRCPLYDEMFARWRRIDKETMADGARARVESVWMKGIPVQMEMFA